MINGELYHDSGDITFPDSAREDNTIIVQLDDGWHIFIPVAESDGSNRNMDRLCSMPIMIKYV